MTSLNKNANNFATTLNGAITNVATSITLTSATGLPAIGTNEYFYLTIDDSTNIEIVKVTDDASSPTFTVVRGQGGTSGTAFADLDPVEMRMVAADVDEKQDDLDGAALTAATVATGDKVLIQDVDDSDNLKTVTTQAIADLALSLASKTIYVTGSGTYTVPAGISAIVVECIGGGGGGAGSLGGGATFASSGGGGAGGYCRSFIVSPSASYAYAVGAGGAATAAGANNGNAGAATTFGTAFISAGGGGGGFFGTAVGAAVTAFASAGSGGTPSGSDVDVTGNAGAFGIAASGNLGSGDGASGYYGGGAKAIANATGNGNTGSTGGGGSGSTSATVSFAGGAGGDGQIIVWEFE